MLAAGGALVAAGAGAFLSDPLGDDASSVAKYAHNAALLLLVAGLTLWATQRSQRGPSTHQAP